MHHIVRGLVYLYALCYIYLCKYIISQLYTIEEVLSGEAANTISMMTDDDNHL